MEALVAAFDDDPWGKADAHAFAKEQFGWGQKKTDELLKLALAEGNGRRARSLVARYG